MRTSTLGLTLLTLLIGSLLGCTGGSRLVSPLLNPDEIAQLPADYIPLFDRLTEEGESSAVLNYDRLALTTLFDGRPMPPELRRRTVEQALDESMARLETIIADTPEAQRARSLWFGERSKDFKGEPYERAMVYFTRGCLYFAVGDFQNARACFLSGALQDAVAEEDQFQSDFASMDLMAGVSERWLGNEARAQEFFTLARQSRPGIRTPASTDNAYVFFFLGNGPTKTAVGAYDHLLRVVPGASAASRASVVWLGAVDERGDLVGSAPVRESSTLIEDVSFQATTRGDRVVDAINRHKAIYRETTETIGVSLMAVGLGIMAASGAGESDEGTLVILAIGAGVTAVGAIVYGIGSLINPRADTRTWSNLPHEIHLWSSTLPPGRNQMMALFYGADGTPLHFLPFALDLPAGGRPGVAFVRLEGH